MEEGRGLAENIRRHYPPPQQCAHWGCWQSSNRWPRAITGVIGSLGGSVDASALRPRVDLFR
jgi:hypothetical protein